METSETIQYIFCSLCGAKVKLLHNWVTGHYRGECPVCHKWFEGYK